MPDMHPVTSTLIKAVGYNLDREEMTVQFHSGDTYVYRDLSLPVYEALVEAKSAGAFFMRNVRGQYETVKK